MRVGAAVILSIMGPFLHPRASQHLEARLRKEAAVSRSSRLQWEISEECYAASQAAQAKDHLLTSCLPSGRAAAQSTSTLLLCMICCCTPRATLTHHCITHPVSPGLRGEPPTPAVLKLAAFMTPLPCGACSLPEAAAAALDITGHGPHP